METYGNMYKLCTKLTGEFVAEHGTLAGFPLSLFACSFLDFNPSSISTVQIQMAPLLYNTMSQVDNGQIDRWLDEQMDRQVSYMNT